MYKLKQTKNGYWYMQVQNMNYKYSYISKWQRISNDQANDIIGTNSAVVSIVNGVKYYDVML